MRSFGDIEGPLQVRPEAIVVEVVGRTLGASRRFLGVLLRGYKLLARLN